MGVVRVSVVGCCVGVVACGAACAGVRAVWGGGVHAGAFFLRLVVVSGVAVGAGGVFARAHLGGLAVVASLGAEGAAGAVELVLVVEAAEAAEVVRGVAVGAEVVVSAVREVAVDALGGADLVGLADGALLG